MGWIGGGLMLEDREIKLARFLKSSVTAAFWFFMQ
jgi:hypothetical protein